MEKDTISLNVTLKYANFLVRTREIRQTYRHHDEYVLRKHQQ